MTALRDVAAVNAFGIGGLNVHAVVDEYNGQDGSYYDRPELPRKTTAGSSRTPSAATQRPTSTPLGWQVQEPIAIVGRGNVLPGASTVDQFASLIREPGTSSQISNAPEHRWRKQLGVRPGVIEPGTTPHNRGGYITDYEFDWLRYRVPPKQIANSNPLQFMLLDAARQALSEAGYEDRGKATTKNADDSAYDKNGFDRARTGVVVGTIFGGEFGHQLLMGLRLAEIKDRIGQRLLDAGLDEENLRQITSDFSERLIKDKPAAIDETGSFTSSTLASRISKELNLMGGAMAIDAGECSSTAALNVAVSMLQSGRCDHVLCAGAQRSMDLGNFEMLAIRKMLARK